MNMTFDEQIAYAIDNPVKSRHHEWTRLEHRDYNTLCARSRTLYDNLRTQFNWSHNEAWVAAIRKFGPKDAEILDMEDRLDIR